MELSLRRDAVRTFRRGDRVRLRRTVQLRRHRLDQGLEGTVEGMDQHVWVRFPEYPVVLFVLYDGDLQLLGRPAWN